MNPIRTVLYATDFSPHADYAFGFAVALAHDYGARLVLLHVATPPPFVTYGELHKAMEDPQGYRRELEEKLHEYQVPEMAGVVEYRLEQGDPTVEIVRVAENLPSNLIVLGTHGWTGVLRLLMGSVAEEVVRKAGRVPSCRSADRYPQPRTARNTRRPKDEFRAWAKRGAEPLASSIQSPGSDTPLLLHFHFVLEPGLYGVTVSRFSTSDTPGAPRQPARLGPFPSRSGRCRAASPCYLALHMHSPSVQGGTALERGLDLVLDRARLHFWRQVYLVCHDNDTSEVAHRTLGGRLLELPLHGAFQGDPAITHRDLDALLRHGGVPLQGVQRRRGDLGIGPLTGAQGLAPRYRWRPPGPHRRDLTTRSAVVLAA